MLQRLVEGGNSVLVIEHNLDVIKTADYLIDLGPEGGDGGGTIVATGTPEQVALCEGSYTGQYLKPMLEKAGIDPAKAAAKQKRVPKEQAGITGEAAAETKSAGKTGARKAGKKATGTEKPAGEEKPKRGRPRKTDK